MTMRIRLSIVACLTLAALSVALIPALCQPGGPPPGGPGASFAEGPGGPHQGGQMAPPPGGPMMDGGGPGGGPPPQQDAPPPPPPDGQMKGGPMGRHEGPMGTHGRLMMQGPPPPMGGPPADPVAIALACLALVGAGVALVLVLRRQHGTALSASRPVTLPGVIAVVDGIVYVAREDRIMTFAAGTLEKLAETPYWAAPAAVPDGDSAAAPASPVAAEQ